MSDKVRTFACEVLGLIGSASKDAVPDLINALADPSDELRFIVAAALGSFGPDFSD